MLLVWAGHRNPRGGGVRLVAQSRWYAAKAGLTPARAFLETWLEVRAQVGKRSLAAVGGILPPWRRSSEKEPPRFLCDPSLGGLARWLRAAGYEAFVDAAVPGHRLPDEALRRGLVLLTTETEVFERRIVAGGSLVLVWVPSALTMREQLRMVMHDLGLGLRTARCMSCGGVLVPTTKEDVFPRIPPRTAKWLDEYFVCASCDRLFWQGTHWERIAKALAEAAAP
jgi:uncharacterized protein with PIN domain